MLKGVVMAVAIIAAEGATAGDQSDQVRDAAGAIRIARTTCGKDWALQDEKYWAARREGELWYVWAPNVPGYEQDQLAIYGSVNATIRAKDGSVDKCTVELEDF